MSPAAAATIAALRESPIIEPLARVLLHSLWIDTAVAVVLAVTLRLTRRSSSNARYAVTCVALLLCVALPALALLPVTTPARHPTHTEFRPLPFTAQLVQQTITDTGEVVLPPAAAPPLLRPALVAAWAIGVAILSLHQLGGWLYLQYARRTARTPVPPEWTARLAQLADRLRIRKRVGLVDCPRLGVPAVAGALRPVILLPVAILTGLPIDHLDAILAHELAHIRRHDYLVNLAQSVIDTLLFYHPAVWWISAQVRQEREHCCDDIAAATTISRVAYAEALLALESARAGHATPTFVPAATTGSLARRIRRLLAASPPPRSAPRRRSAIAAIVATACALAPLLIARAQQQPPPTADQRPTAISDTATDVPPGKILPADLEPNPQDYHIAPGDTVQISVTDLVGPGVVTTKTARVADSSGTASLPIIGQVKIAGLTEAQAEKAVAKAYLDHNLIQNAQVSVTVTDARGNTFSVVGAGSAPGVYPIPRSDARLLDALALARANPSRLTAVTLIRREGQRRIDIPPAKLAAGDPAVNVVLRPGDTLTLTGPDAEKSFRFVRIVVESDGPHLVRNGVKSTKPDNWPAIESALRAIPQPDLSNTVLELAAGSKDVTVEAYFAAQAKAADLAKKLGLAYVSNVGIDRPAQPAPPTTPAADADNPPAFDSAYRFCQVRGHVARTGAYAIGSGATLKAILIAAGIPMDADLTVTLTRHHVHAPHTSTTMVSLKDLLAGKADDPAILPGDDINVALATPKPDTATPPTSAPAAGLATSELVDQIAMFDKVMAAAKDEEADCQDKLNQLTAKGLGNTHPSIENAKRQLDVARAKVQKRLSMQIAFHDQTGHYADQALGVLPAAPPRDGQYYISGNIQRPGVYTIGNRDVTVRQAIAAAGGFDNVVPRHCVALVRRTSGKEQLLLNYVPVSDLATDSRLNIPLEDGDLLEVADREAAH